MNKKLFALLLTLCLLSSCKTKEKVLYFQDINSPETIQGIAKATLQIVPGDKLGVTITSSTTPELALRYNLAQTNSSSLQQNADNVRYMVDENGCIDLLGIGRVEVAGLTRSEAADKIQKIFRSGIINDAVVTVATYDQYITVLGDVTKPGRVDIKREHLTILEAIGDAGDLLITGRRDNIRVFRQEGKETKVYFVNLKSKDILNSPVYNLKQNDVVYVEPNRLKMGQSTANDNSLRNVSVWISIASFLTTLGVLLFK